MLQAANGGKQASLPKKGSAVIDRRISVAPMMDWTDDL